MTGLLCDRDRIDAGDILIRRLHADRPRSAVTTPDCVTITTVLFDDCHVALDVTSCVVPSPGLFVGGGLDMNRHSQVRPSDSAAATWDQSALVAYDQTHGFAIDREVSGGTNVGLFYDTRDNATNAQRGWLAGASNRAFFGGFLGGDSTWQDLYVDVRAYRKLDKESRHRLAFWFLGDMVTGGTAPYLDLPATASNDGRSARGYAEG